MYGDYKPDDMDNRDIEVSLLSIYEMPERTSLYRSAVRRYDGGEIGVSLRAWLDAGDSDSLTLTAEVIYSDKDAMMHPTLFSACAAAEFSVVHSTGSVTIGRGRLLLPHHLLTLMLGTVVGALRGIIAVRTRGTALEGSPLPLLNIADLARSLSHAV